MISLNQHHFLMTSLVGPTVTLWTDKLLLWIL